MGVELTKDSVDLGIVVKDKEASLRFYRDTLGFEFVAESDMGNGMLMQRLMCGTSMIKLVTFAQTPELANPGGGINGATGYRYWTISVANLEAIVAEAKEAGYQVPWEPREIRAGVSVAMVEDPDGNWVELLQRAEGAV